MKDSNEPRTVQAVEISLEILRILQEQTKVGVTGIANELGRSKGTIHSHFTTLVNNEYVVQNGDT